MTESLSNDQSGKAPPARLCTGVFLVMRAHLTTEQQQRRSSSNAGPASGPGPSRKSSTPSSTSRGSLTPSSGSSPGLAFSSPSSPRAGHKRGSPDEPLPSVEGRDGSPAGTNTRSSRTSHARTPSVSVSPPSSASPIRNRDSSPSAGPRRAGSSRADGETESIAARLDDLDLGPASSSLHMPSVRAAIADIAGGLDERRSQPQRQTASPDARGPLSGLRPPGRRSRAGSRTSLAVHDVEDEELPPSRFHDPAVQGAFGDAKALMDRLVGVLESSPLHESADSTIKRLHAEAQALARFQCPSTRTVGFVGDSGVGKPPGLFAWRAGTDGAGAREKQCLELASGPKRPGEDREYMSCAAMDVFADRFSNSGAACTCVVTEYHHRAGNDFVVDVELFAEDEVAKQLAQLLGSYRRFHLHAGEMTRGDGAEEAEEQAKVALDTFRAMFRGRLGDEKFLAEDPEADVLSTMRSWLEETYPQDEGEHTMDEVRECSSLLMRLTSEARGARESVVWPYVKKIKVFLNSHILSKGLVLVDLPGLRDVNAARRKITERYLLRCDEILAVCNIGRATTDVGVASVFELAEKAGLSRVGIVCTKSDDIRAEEAKKDWKGARAKRIQELSDGVSGTQCQIDDTNLELAEFEDVELTEEEKDEELELNRRLRKLGQGPPSILTSSSTSLTMFLSRRKVLQQKAFDLKEYLIKTRNASVSKELQKEYSPKVPAGTLHVFCVSNTEYWAKRRLAKDEALPSLHLSGILALRKHCLAIIGDSQLSIATKFVANDVPALLGDVALWIESGAGSASAEQKQAVRRTLDKVERKLKRVNKDMKPAASD
ncbi:nuclear GTPase SLIP-GC [Colletotrichum liriopes]|uniref:Nuclear GTPase SLIP-GC n=1 Tax=Colletotrichum liriopes TaxID=708192 RepID=A0AA37GJ79_9PEZI|nr:nuclear GTPase SLIP-GC [Colletotrichum liriopes]